jgi:hypothetical protein
MHHGIEHAHRDDTRRDTGNDVHAVSSMRWKLMSSNVMTFAIAAAH